MHLSPFICPDFVALLDWIITRGTSTLKLSPYTLQLGRKEVIHIFDPEIVALQKRYPDFVPL